MDIVDLVLSTDSPHIVTYTELGTVDSSLNYNWASHGWNWEWNSGDYGIENIFTLNSLTLDHNVIFGMRVWSDQGFNHYSFHNVSGITEVHNLMLDLAAAERIQVHHNAIWHNTDFEANFGAQSASVPAPGSVFLLIAAIGVALGASRARS